jgi:thiol-disulfide isomerase/thioredoxin
MVFRVARISMMALMWGVILTGCNRLGGSVLTSEPTSEPSTSPTLPTQVTILPSLTKTTALENAYPAPVTETVVATTQDSAAYPSPIEATQPSASSPVLTQVENIAANPYPLLETPLPQQVGVSGSTPYPPPAESPILVSTTSAAPSSKPTEIAPTSLSPQSTPSPSGTPIITPQATIVRIKFVASDPNAVNLEAGRPQMVVFFADWCTLCKSVAPVILGLESKYNDRMNFIYLDVDEAGTKTLQKKFSYRLTARPRIYLIDGTGVILRDWTGYVALEELQQAIDSVVPATVAPATVAPISP